MRVLRRSLRRPGSANTSAARREMSRSVRTLGNFTDIPMAPVESASSLSSGFAAPMASLQPAARLVPAGLHREQRPGVALEECEVGAVAADRDFGGERAAAADGAQRLPDQRRLAVSSRRDEEDLLAGCQVAHEAIQLVDAIDERCRRHDLAVHEWVFHYVNLRNGYVL